VAEIRRRYDNESITHVALAREYGVSPSTIGSLVNYKTWTDVPAASVADTSTTTLAAPRPAMADGCRSSVGKLADGTPLPGACVPDSMEPTDFPSGPEADERHQPLAPFAQNERKLECSYQVAV
jgi:hypothetical protein